MLTIVITILIGYFYYFLESIFYSDVGCGCSSACVGYYPTLTSRIIGYFLLISSTILFIISIWKIKGTSRWWTIPSIIVFGIAFYGNGYMLFNKGACGNSLNKTTFFINQVKLGNYAKADAETINIDSLKSGKYKGKLLGYSFDKNELTLFRIDEKPIVVKTRFLFWEIRNNVILNDISYGLNTYRNLSFETQRGHYEFIGGKGMKEDDFISEFILTNKGLTGKILKNKKITDEKDGTTRFSFELE